MIFKFLAFIAVLFLVYVVFFKKNREKNISSNDEESIDTFVECPKCGTYVSKDDAILSNGQYFCSKGCI